MKTKYYVKFHTPGCFYTMDFPSAMSLKDAKSFVRTFLGVSRLPNGVEFFTY